MAQRGAVEKSARRITTDYLTEIPTMYTEDDFKRCMFNPMVTKPMLKAHPRLAEIVLPDWAKQTNFDNIIRYVIMTYDPQSPLISNERDLNYRKGVAADLAGFDTTDEEAMQSIYDCSNKVVLDFILKYLMRFVRSREWGAIVATEYKYWEAIKLLLVPIKGDGDKAQLEAAQKKEVLSDSIDTGIKRIENYYKLFFGEDEKLEKQAKTRITPEGISNGE